MTQLENQYLIELFRQYRFGNRTHRERAKKNFHRFIKALGDLEDDGKDFDILGYHETFHDVDHGVKAGRTPDKEFTAKFSSGEVSGDKVYLAIPGQNDFHTVCKVFRNRGYQVQDVWQRSGHAEESKEGHFATIMVMFEPSD